MPWGESVTTENVQKLIPRWQVVNDAVLLSHDRLLVCCPGAILLFSLAADEESDLIQYTAPLWVGRSHPLSETDTILLPYSVTLGRFSGPVRYKTAADLRAYCMLWSTHNIITIDLSLDDQAHPKIEVVPKPSVSAPTYGFADVLSLRVGQCFNVDMSHSHPRPFIVRRFSPSNPAFGPGVGRGHLRLGCGDKEGVISGILRLCELNDATGIPKTIPNGTAAALDEYSGRIAIVAIKVQEPGGFPPGTVLQIYDTI